MPNILVSDSLYRRIQSLMRPEIDTEDTVVRDLLDARDRRLNDIRPADPIRRPPAVSPMAMAPDSDRDSVIPAARSYRPASATGSHAVQTQACGHVSHPVAVGANGSSGTPAPDMADAPSPKSSDRRGLDLVVDRHGRQALLVPLRDIDDAMMMRTMPRRLRWNGQMLDVKEWKAASYLLADAFPGLSRNGEMIRFHAASALKPGKPSRNILIVPPDDPGADRVAFQPQSYEIVASHLSAGMACRLLLAMMDEINAQDVAIEFVWGYGQSARHPGRSGVLGWPEEAFRTEL